MDELLTNEKVREVINRILKKKSTELSIGVVYQSRMRIFNYTNSTNSYYDIGSLSKIFTSLIILKASQNGLISLDLSNLSTFIRDTLASLFSLLALISPSSFIYKLVFKYG